MADHENENQNEEEMEEEILINQEEGEGEGQDFYAIEMQINDEPYLIVIGKTEENKIFLRLMNKEDQNKPFFHNEFSLEDLKNINPIFNGIESEDIAFQYLVSNLNDAGNKKTIIYIIVISIVLILILGALAYFLGKKLNENRKKRANELNDEDFEYSTSDSINSVENTKEKDML